MWPSASTAPSNGSRCNITARMAPAAAVLAARAVLRFQVGDDVVRLVHLAARVGIDEIRHLDLAAALHELLTAGAAVRHGMCPVVEVELGEDFAHLAAVRTALEVVQLEHLGRFGAAALGHARERAATEADEAGREREDVVRHAHVAHLAHRSSWVNRAGPGTTTGRRRCPGTAGRRPTLSRRRRREERRPPRGPG